MGRRTHTGTHTQAHPDKSVLRPWRAKAAAEEEGAHGPEFGFECAQRALHRGEVIRNVAPHDDGVTREGVCAHKHFCLGLVVATCCPGPRGAHNIIRSVSAGQEADG